MRRLIPALAALALVAPTAAGARTISGPVQCQDYCAERAAEHCDRIDSWGCTWYILGCLAGCNLASL
jgi:hypothetical protein